MASSGPAPTDGSRVVAESLAVPLAAPRPDKASPEAIERVTDPSDPINMIIAACDSEKIGLVQAADRIEACLLQKGLLRRFALCPQLVGVDPENRASEGVNAVEVGLLAGDIAEVGWSWAASAHATCIEEAPGATNIEDFNVRIAQGSDLAPVEAGQIRFGSLACSHTNMALRAIAAGRPSTDPSISDGANFSLARLEQRDPEYARAVRNGLTWNIYTWKVRVLYPKLCSLVQAARNVGATLNRKESEMQTMLRLHLMSVQQRDDVSGVPWASIKRSIARTRPPCVDKLGSMICFVIARSGGKASQHLNYLAVFHRNSVDASVRGGLPAAMYDSLAAFPHHHLALALLQAAWTCPAHYVKNLECAWVSAAEVSSLGKAIASGNPEGKHALAAGEMILAARVAADSGGSTTRGCGW